MRNNLHFHTLARIVLVVLVFIGGTGKASAIPIFAQRYHLQCGACHSVLPELNAFGNSFRNHGYRLPLPEHGTTVVALRFQEQYLNPPGSGTPTWEPGFIVLGAGEIGRIEAFVHYNLGAQGGPSGAYLSYLATYDQNTKTLWRAGLFELPLVQSPGQRLDDLQQYGYYGAHVGLNDLPLASPRWGAQWERTIGNGRLDAVVALGEFKGSAYGGAPIPTGENTFAEQPEYSLWYRQQVIPNVEVGGEALTGIRRIVPITSGGFSDPYNREGLWAHGSAFQSKLDVQLEQWWGHDNNSDGLGTIVGSSGGYARIKYYVTPHAYFGVRYDTQATPLITQDVVYYAAAQVFFMRFLVQEVHTVNQPSQLGGALTLAFPPPLIKF